MAPAIARLSPEAVEVAAFDDATLEIVPRQCQLDSYTKITVPAFKISGEIVAFSSPDSTYAVTKQLFAGAKSSILIGIYDFTATYIKDLLLRAMRRGVKVTLMLDLDGRTGETELFDELVKYGCRGVSAPSCASEYAHYFPCCHEKVIVIDDAWTIVQSGNYTDNSIPENEEDGKATNGFVPGNRDMGVAVKDAALAKFFKQVLLADIRRETSAEGHRSATEGLRGRAQIELLEAAPSEPPKELFPSQKFQPGKPIDVQPILSPDNYMDMIPQWLDTANQSIYIEQQYIRGKQASIRELLARVQKRLKKKPGLQVQIIVAAPFPGAKAFAKESQELTDLGSEFGLTMGTHIRILNPGHFVHCHNKLIVVDEQEVLISSQNWSETAVAKNREAGLLISYPQLAQRFAQIFKSDWQDALHTVPKKAAKFYAPEALTTGQVVRLDPGDYEEV